MIIYILTATGTVRMLLAENVNLITSEKMHSEVIQVPKTKMYLFTIGVLQLLPVNMETLVRYEPLNYRGLLTILICYTSVLSPHCSQF